MKYTRKNKKKQNKKKQNKTKQNKTKGGQPEYKKLLDELSRLNYNNTKLENDNRRLKDEIEKFNNNEVMVEFKELTENMLKKNMVIRETIDFINEENYTYEELTPMIKMINNSGNSIEKKRIKIIDSQEYKNIALKIYNITKLINEQNYKIIENKKKIQEFESILSEIDGYNKTDAEVVTDPDRYIPK